MGEFDATLQKYGADLAALRYFDVDSHDLLPYATLVGARNAGDVDLAALGGVYEWQNSPLVFLVDGDQLQDVQQLNRIRRLLAMRGDAPYLGVVLPGQLTLYRVALDRHPPDGARIPLDISSGQEGMTFAYLGNERPGLAGKRRWISDVVLKLLSTSIDDLKNTKNTFSVSSNDAISLVGRALFTRFLGDRNLLPKSIAPGDPKQVALLFDGPEQAEKTSDWLDNTFNGDFLPLTEGLFYQLPQEAFRTLGNIMYRTLDGQFFLEWEENWARLDFAHIPVGVLSQAYESYLKQHAPVKQRKEGGYYTPVHIADLMVRGAFHALRRDGLAHKAKVLDPAVGGGVFLLTAFRQLVAERWRHDQIRPDTATLREILYEQVTGFDINEEALRFAALGLYLISIELDPHPEPVRKLRFTNLRNTVLHNFGDDSDGETSGSLGSLGDKVGAEHVGRYDLVIGNPPWTSATRLAGWRTVENTIAQIARTRLSDESLRPSLPNEVLDLPFVWRAMEWAKPGAQISFALHARLLFQQGDTMPDARNALFRSLDVTGIINGTDLRQTKVWPRISAPFCILFARNQIPPPGAGFRLVSPRVEITLNSSGGLRVDVNNADMVASEQVVERPEILKILFRGNRLDLEVYDRLASQELPTLEAYWKERFGVFRGRPKYTGNGYQKLRLSSRVRIYGDGLAGVSAAYLAELPELTKDAIKTPLVDSTKLSEFSLDRIHDPRPRSLFQGPMLVVHKSPPAVADRIRVAVADNDLVFNESYYGYSAKEHPKGKQLVRYLVLVLSSKIALWYALITSGEFGFEREVIEKFIIDNIPMPSFDALERSVLEQIDPLFDAIVKSDDEQNWARVDAWVAELYGLRQGDLQVIADTLNFNLPFGKNKSAAQALPSTVEVSAFCGTLASELEPWAKRSGRTIKVISANQPKRSPWRVVRIDFQGTSTNQTTDVAPTDWTEVLRIADQMAVTEIIHPDLEKKCLWVGRLNQARYWSRSQARLVARRIIWDHVDMLGWRAAE